MLSLRNGDRGQAIMEFAVIFPIFALVIFIVIDGAVLMGRYGEINHAAKEGARLAATGSSTSTVCNRIKAQAQGILDDASCGTSSSNDIRIRYASGAGGSAPEPGEVGSTVKITIDYEYELFTPLGGGSLPGMPLLNMPDHFDVSACAITRLERPRQPPGGSTTSDNEC